MESIPIDWANVNWLYVVLLGIFAFAASYIGHLLSFHHRGLGAVLSAVLFVAIFVFWSYYPHGLPLPVSLKPPAQPAAATVMPSQPAAPMKPANPVTDITPPKNPVTDVTPPKQ
jgi:hypothetical protein